MNPDTLFTLSGLEFAYDGRMALTVPNLRIEEGRTIALAGPNGSGKTTLLKILNDLLRPTSGSALFRGKPTAGNRELRECSVYVHQSPYLLAGSVFHNVAFGLHVRHFPDRDIRSRVSESLELVGLAGFEHREAKNLSGGETQRVALARALAVKPEILLLDEPTAQTDKGSGERIRSVLSYLAAEGGVTVILSSHDTALALDLADRVVFLEEGMVYKVEEQTRPHA